MFSSEIYLRKQGIEPGAAGSRTKNANHFSAQTVFTSGGVLFIELDSMN